jgi:predicted permease
MLIKLAILYGFIGLGFILQKIRPVDTKSISSILLGPFLTIFVFGKIALSSLALTDINALFLTFICASLVALFCFILSRYIWTAPDTKNMANLNASAVANTNSGYFGIPVAFFTFTPTVFSHYLVANFGITVFMLTIGYCLYANNTDTIKNSLTQLAKLPAFYALISGFGVSLFNIPIPDYLRIILEYSANVTGVIFSIGGMMIIGIGLCQLTIKDICWKTIFWSNIFCFTLWPLVVWILLLIDQSFLHWIMPDDYKIFWLMALCPIGVNAVLYATQFNLHPKKAALMVFSSTIIALPILALASKFLLR